MMKKLLGVCFLLLSVGCAVDPGRAPKGLADVPLEKSGVVFGSIGVGARSPYTNQGLRYRAKGSAESGSIQFVQSGIIDTPIDFADGQTKGSVFAIRLPPGEYELYNVLFFVNRAQFGSTTFSSKADFSIPFTVTEGSATYLGEFMTHSVYGKNFFGMSMPGGGYFVVANKLDRDFSFLAKKAVHIPRERVTDATVSIPHPMFRAKPLPPDSSLQMQQR
jgi:hypothetical protein